MKPCRLVPALLACLLAAGNATAQSAAREALLARARSLELATAYAPPPGEAMSHHAAGIAKVMCSAVFITGLDPDFAFENVGFFTGPPDARRQLGRPAIDRTAKAVHVRLPDGSTRTARQLGDQGCVALPAGRDEPHFTPVRVPSRLPAAEKQPWPTGDLLPNEPPPAGIDLARVRAAVDAAFAAPEELTAAFVVTWKGLLVGERYGPGITMHTPLESWSKGKSVAAALLGTLIRRGVYTLEQPAPIPEWQAPGDARAKIRIADLLHMSSGLRIRAPQDPDYDPRGYPDHVYLYTTGENAYRYAATRPQQWPPGAVGRYRNTDPVLAGYLIRLGAEKLGEDFLGYPRRALFDRIGIRSMVLETDPHGNFLLQGYELASARDWARLGMLFLQDGVWNGVRILPEGYARFVSTVAPAWAADGRPYYGGFFWINTNRAFPVPADAYYMAGSGGQYTLMIPSHDLVVTRLGHYRGGMRGNPSFARALALLMEAVPGRR